MRLKQCNEHFFRDMPLERQCFNNEHPEEDIRGSIPCRSLYSGSLFFGAFFLYVCELHFRFSFSLTRKWRCRQTGSP